jgi:hypothetical protein
MDTKKALQEAFEALEKTQDAKIAVIEKEHAAIGEVFVAFSRHTWMEATKAEFPPMAKWTAKEEALNAWSEWYKKEKKEALTPDTKK